MKLQPVAQRFGFLPAGGGRLVTPLIAIMSFLSALALAGALLLSDAAGSFGAAVGRDATVQIVEANPDLAGPQVRAAAALLRRHPAVTGVRVLPDAEVERLLQPWLGSAARKGGVLPMPAMIDIALTPRADAPALARELHAVAPAARLDVQARWLAPLADALRGLSGLAVAIVALVALATAAVVALGTRSGLGGHAATIDLLHTMGAEDADIARVFQYRYLIHGITGGLIGVACAAGAMAALARVAGGLGLGAPPLAAWGLIALVPLSAGALAAFVARVSVARALKAQL